MDCGRSVRDAAEEELTKRAPVPRRIPWWLFAPALFGVAFSVYLVAHAHQANRGIDGVPLDDPWIHLTYARNLYFHHSFSYFPGEKATAGSTSPLYTMLLALGFAFTRNEKVLSYALGVLFHAAFLLAAALWARKQLGAPIWAAAFALVLALDWRIAILSVSGMETSLFLFLIALSFWAWATKRWTLLGIGLGMGVWTRPDALILVGVFALSSLTERLKRAPARPHRSGKRAPEEAPAQLSRPVPLRPWLVPFGALLLLYSGFNLVTGGTILPNTFAAKHAYYIAPAAYFLTHGVRECFLASGFQLLTPLALIAIAVEVVRLVRRRSGPYRAEAGWAVALPLAYVFFVPTAHRFSRYLVPALPAVALLGLVGLREGLRLAIALTRPVVGGKRPPEWREPAGVLGILLLVPILAAQAAGAPAADTQYRTWCAYHYQRHERCGRWLEEHTPPTAVIATHDVGAIAYYSERKIVDIVGLIQRDAVPRLHKPDYVDFLVRFFQREKVTHLAFLENWMEVANQEPLWLADEHPELLRIYAWVPGRTVLVPERVTALNGRAIGLANDGNIEGAIQVLRRSLDLCPTDSRTWFLLGAVQDRSGDAEVAARSYREALDRFPEYEDARFYLDKSSRTEERGGKRSPSSIPSIGATRPTRGCRSSGRRSWGGSLPGGKSPSHTQSGRPRSSLRVSLWRGSCVSQPLR